MTSPWLFPLSVIALCRVTASSAVDGTQHAAPAGDVRACCGHAITNAREGEPTMRSHWTNPTIIRRPTIAALSAAALLVAADQPACPSRPGGRRAAYWARTAAAHGN